MPALPTAVTMASSATVAIAKAAEAAGGSLLDSLVPMLTAHPWAAALLVGLGLLRAALPWLRARSGKTATMLDDKAVTFLSWLLLGIKRRTGGDGDG